MHVETISFLKKNAANLPLKEPLIIRGFAPIPSELLIG